MKPEHWQQAKEILHAALGLPAGEREAYLERTCGGDAALREEVESLLASSESAAGFLEAESLDDLAAKATSSAGHLPEGYHVGPYRIRQLLGQGGMGVVYLAVRDDDEYKKRVCIKISYPLPGDEEFLVRLRRERQILASLEHDNIATLLDGGTLEDGRPYLVMEYIDGQPIDDFCDNQKLPIAERLELFLRVCGAVQYAHQNLVVHRDLKPSNILVTADGVPKLLDFGIAKLLNPELSSETLLPTRIGLAAMTPEYASPEQVRGEPITTASDVYSLGVLLYHLLTGRRPYQTANTSLAEIARIICEQEPVRPSAAVTPGPSPSAEGGGQRSPDELANLRGTTPARLRRRLVGDLDAIEAQALRKSTRRRYGSVEQLAEDLRRHLQRLPVRARKVTLAYRAGKFVRRHRIGVAFAAALALLTVALAVQSVRLKEEAERANRESLLAQQVSSLLLDLFEISESGAASVGTITVRELLDRGAERIGAELEDQPAMRARGLETIGIAYEKLGLYAESERHLSEALALRREYLPDEEIELGSVLHHLARVQRRKGDYEKAEKNFLEALEIRKRELGSEHSEVGETLGSLSGVYWHQGRLAKARELGEQALAIKEVALGPDHERVAEAVNDLAIVIASQGIYDEAIPLFQRSVEILERAKGPENPSFAQFLNNLAMAYQLQGDNAAAVSPGERALELRQRYLDPGHPKVAESLNTLAAIYRAQGRLEEAEGLESRVLDIWEDSLGPDHRLVAVTLESLASLHHAMGRPREAETEIRRSLGIREKQLGPDHPDVASGLMVLATIQLADGRSAEAEEAYERALAIREQALGPDHPDTVASREALGVKSGGAE